MSTNRKNNRGVRFELWPQNSVGSGRVLEDEQRDLQRRWAEAKPGTHPPLQPGLWLVQFDHGRIEELLVDS